MVNNYQNYIDKLKSLTEQNNIKAVRTYLESLPKNIKGRVFEDYLSLIFEHNGWLVKQTGKRGDAGADLLLYLQGNSEPDFIIQAKNWNKPLNDNDVSSELNKFEKKSIKKYNCKQYQLFSINGYTKSALKYSNYNIKLRDWSDIADLIGKYEKTKPKTPSLELFSHNQRAFSSIKEMYGYSNRVCVSHATGTGKSYLIASVLQSHQDRKTIIVAPTNIILNELKDKFFYLMGNAKLMTYSKVANIRKADAGLIILDEFHRAGAVKWGAGVKRIMDANPGSIVFGTSATPYRYFEGRDMSDEIFEGNVASDLALPRAIAEQILPSPKYVYGIYDLNEESNRVIRDIDNAQKLTKEQKNDYKALLNSHKVDFERSGGMSVILKKHVKSSDRKFIIFCDDTEHLEMMELDVQKWFRKAFPGVGTERYIVHSKEPGTDATLEKFKKVSDKKFHLLFSIDMLNEGLHVVGVNGVIMLRRTASPRIFYQQIGRCIASGGYDAPIIFDFVNNFNSIMATDFLSDVTEAVKSEQERRGRDGLSRIDIPVDIIDETKDIEDVFFSIESKIREWLPFEEAREIVRAQKFNNITEFRVWNPKPPGIPAKPFNIYKEWIHSEDWIGKEVNKSKGSIPYLEAEKWMHETNKKLLINNQTKYNNYARVSRLPKNKRDFTKIGLPKDFPPLPINTPVNAYKYEHDPNWKGLPHYLGYERVADRERVYRSFEDARDYVHEQELKTYGEWVAIKKTFPSDIHRNPKNYYNNEWIRWGDWLGNEDFYTQRELNDIRKKVPFKKAHEFVLKLELKTGREYERYCKGELKLTDKEPYPIWLTPLPRDFYEGKGWKDMGHFLGTGSLQPQQKIFWSFKKCRDHLIKLKVLNSSHDYAKYRKGTFKGLPKAPDRVPSRPDDTYREDWKDWPHFLGYEKKNFLTFSKAKKIARKQNFRIISAYRKWIDRPSNMPFNPARKYGDEKGWKGMADFLGIVDFVPVNKNKIGFSEARKFCRKLKLSSSIEWGLYVAGKLDGYEKNPSNIPSQPHTYYKKKNEWISYPDFLGYEPKQKKK